MVQAVRGAIQVKENASQIIKKSVKRLVSSVMEQNMLEEESLVSIVFSQTKDLTDANPATALREMGFKTVPLFCTQEPEYHGSLERVIRVMVTFNTDSLKDTVPIYLEGAEALRADLFDT